MIILGLTGSIGMGKSTVAQMFSDAGAVVSDADKVVHQLLNKTDIIEKITKFVPEAVEAGQVNRQILGKIVFSNHSKLKQLERLLHPKVRKFHDKLIYQARLQGRRLVILEIPLLFESHATAQCDAVIVVTAPSWIQRRRVMARPHMDRLKLNAIMKRQMPDAKKRHRADYLIHTSFGLANTRKQVKQLVALLQLSLRKSPK